MLTEGVVARALSLWERVAEGRVRVPLPSPKFRTLLDYARRMRHEDTLVERIVWVRLRDRRTLGLKFRRQVPIDQYIVDFYCHELRLIIELDGMSHDRPERVAHDKERDLRLTQLGYHILRVSNEVILNDPQVLTEMIRSYHPHPAFGHPLPEGEGPRP